MGITLNHGAVLKRMVLRADRGEYLPVCREMSGQSNATTNHRPKDVGKRRVAEDEAAVRRIETCITNWNNPFQAVDKLHHYHLASGRNATSDISTDLLGAYAKREEVFKEFVYERLDTDGQKDYAPIPKMKPKTFKSLKVATMHVARASSIRSHVLVLVTVMSMTAITDQRFSFSR